ncbi:Carboxylic ester hydrolase [Aphelenchoides fujianensis]|nr:Carboxylic ester hydrolase [Aphelenchoides fujianensis]
MHPLLTGDFYYGSAVLFNDTEIVRKHASDEIVFVIAAFRLGVFGFTDLGQELPDAPYNNGMLDILAALRWIQQEGPKFGGDPTRITAYGPSGGASTVECLLASPAVEAGAISRAILISGAGSLRPHANRRLSRAVSREVNPTPLLITDTTIENALLRRSRSMPRMCAWFFSAFGFEAAATAEECGRVYEATGPQEITRDAMHAFVVRMAAFNARRGQPAYLGLFAQVNHSKHADDLTYLIGLHPIARMTENDRLMDEWYPRMIKNFIKGGAPVEGKLSRTYWKPVDGEGRGFYRMNFELEDAAEVDGERRFKERPHFVSGGVFDRPAVEFWNRRLQAVDDEARRTGGRKAGELLAADEPPAVERRAPSSNRKWISDWTTAASLIVVFAAALILVTTGARMFVRCRQDKRRVRRMADEQRRILDNPTTAIRYVQ